MVDKIAEASLLFDFYGQLLTKKQQQVMKLYHEENLSLSEIGLELGISRQAVHDALKNAERALTEYEVKLGLVKSLMESRKAIARIDREIDKIAAVNSENESLVEQLCNIKSIINKLEG